MDDFECGGLTFNSKFDSGNLSTVELLKKNEDPIPDLKAEYFNGLEFKLYTRPDCAGTVYENGNRTWFYFSVKGGVPNQVAKFYIMNLNRQAKLYGQGMQPVVRIGKFGKWERIKDKPSFQVDNENFILGFMHRIPENPNVLVYYAFTYPYSCTELNEFLDYLDKKFERSPKEYEYIMHRISSKCQPAETNSTNPEGIDDSDNNLSSDSNSSFSNIESSDHDTANSAKLTVESNSADGNSDRELKIEELKKFEEQDLQNEIYYYRETLIYSLQGRRVYLLTITSFHGITEDHEPDLENLFPQPNHKRCHIFKKKKVIFLSSRVHPGETPASFILNGFINFLLDKRNPTASILRSMYVFKIVPFLNPDGVFNGMYRSDTLGQNLNRVYLNPRLEIHPTIYAARKLIRFYHYGYDKKEEFPIEKRTKKKTSGTSPAVKENVESPKLHARIEPPVDILKEGSITSIQSCSSVASSSSNNDGDTKSSLDLIGNENDNTKTSEICLSPVHSLATSQGFLNVSISANKKKNFLKQNKLNVIKSSGSCGALKLSKLNASSAVSSVGSREPRPKSVGSYNENKNKKMSARKEHKSNTGGGNRSPMHPVALGSYQSSSNHLNSNRSSRMSKNTEICVKSDDDKMYCSSSEEKSNLFLYIDFHGHASKKGVFMYGNHLPNIWEAVECMLLPRLMSMNCAHFHFDACNFSERNMYLKGKRDGLSKEGSGRVAMYKSIGLIKSYTLEGNYNTGKMINVLPQKAKDKNPPKIINPVPPKYTPAVFEEVGRALGPSILDLTNSNPSSRLGNSEFRTLQGLRNSLKTMEFDRNLASRCASATSSTKATRPKKRMKNKSNISSNFSRASSSHTDPLKENKALYEMPSSWELLESGSSNVNNVNVSLENNSLVILPLQTTTQQSLSNNNNIMQTNQTLTSLSCASSNSSSTTAISLTTTTSTSTLIVTPISSPSVMSLIAATGDIKTKKITSNTSFKAKKSNQTLYGKKENATSSKKIKTFCDNQIATSGISDPPSSISQVPRKRIKVSQHLLHTTPLTVTTAIASKLELLESTNLASSIIIPITQQIIKDNDVPCCSHSLKRSNTCIKTTTIPNLIITNAAIQSTSSTAAAATSSSSSSTTSNVLPGTSFVVKSVLSGFRATSSKPNAGGGVNQLRKSSSLPNLSKKLTFDGAPALGTTKKIKKKRIIKNETTMTGLKRKKSRVKTGWH